MRLKYTSSPCTSPSIYGVSVDHPSIHLSIYPSIAFAKEYNTIQAMSLTMSLSPLVSLFSSWLIVQCSPLLSPFSFVSLLSSLLSFPLLSLPFFSFSLFISASFALHTLSLNSSCQSAQERHLPSTRRPTQ